MSKWEMVKLGDIYEITSSKRVFQSDWTDKGIPFYRAREISKLSAHGFVTNELFISEHMYEDYSNKYGIPNAGDIMVTGVGTLGVCYVVKDTDKFYFKDGNIIWLKQKINIDSNYVKWAFKSNLVKEQITRNSSGTTVGTYTITNAKATIIPSPPLKTQKQISKTLDTAAELLAMRKQQLVELDTLIKSTFYDMFGDPLTNFKSFSTIRLEDFIEFMTSGSRGWAQYYVPNGEKFITIKNVKNGRLNFSELTFVKAPKNKESLRTRVEKGDLLISITADLGRTAVVDEVTANEGAYINQHLSLVRLKREVNPVYISAYLESQAGKVQFNKLNQVGVKAGLNFNSIKSLEIMLPPLKLQNQFATAVTKIEEQKALVKKAVDETQVLFDSLMCKYFD